MNPVDLYQTVHFLSNDDANYVGMANTYQTYLIDRGDLDQQDLNGDVSLHLDVLLSESKKAFIGRSTIVMTSINDVTEMATRLLASGVKHLSITLRGTSSAGYSGTSLDEWPLGKHVGTTSD